MSKDIKLNNKVIGKKHGIALAIGLTGESDNVYTDTASVIYDDGIYKMWYGGYDGSHYRIHYATSKDGISWTKHGVVIPLGDAGESDDMHTYYPSVIYDGGIYKMWYGGDDGRRIRIHYATSKDGISWTKHGVVIPLGDAGESDCFLTDTPSVIYDGIVYKMWYTGHDGSQDKIHYTTSEDGLNWTKHGVIIPLGDAGESDERHMYSPFVIYDGNIFKMWYTGTNGIKSNIHYATSEDGVTWTKHGTVLDAGKDGDSDSEHIDSPSVIYDGKTFHMWYTGFDGSKWRIHYAELSESGLTK